MEVVCEPSGASLSLYVEVTAGDLPPLPGPGLDIPVDTDGDGVSRYGERYAFNYWLGLGGDLGSAIESSKPALTVIDLSDFFSSSAAALSPEAGLAEARPFGAAVEPQPAGTEGAGAGASCATTALLLAPFSPASNPPTDLPCPPACNPPFIVQECDVFLDDPEDPLIHQVDGHAMDGAGNLFVTRDFGPSGDGGVAKLKLTNVHLNGNVPISPSKVSLVAGPELGTNIPGAEQIVFEASSNNLLVTQELPAGAVKRLNLNASPVTVADEFPPGTGGLAFSEGLVLVPSGRPEFGNAGDLFIGEDIDVGGRIHRWDRQAEEMSVAVDSGCGFLSNLEGMEGLAMGDFNGQGTFGVYFTLGEGNLDTLGLMVSGGCTPEDPHLFHAEFFPAPPDQVLYNENPDGLFFDPLSGSLFVSEDEDVGEIWRVRPDGSNIEFCTTLREPQGMSFHPRGVMLVSEKGAHRVTVLDGWRFKFNRGDANADGRVNISDPQFIFNWLFLGGAVPPCFDAADVNDDSMINITDGNYLMNFLYQGGPQPKYPFVGGGPTQLCGFDPTPDLLGCASFLPACAIGF
jgi:hypothetical protein